MHTTSSFVFICLLVFAGHYVSAEIEDQAKSLKTDGAPLAMTTAPSIPITEPTIDTTTAEPTTTTTEPTTTTTTTEPTTTTTTKPKPMPTAGPWFVTDPDTNITCIVIKLSSTFIVPYSTVNKEDKNASLTMPSSVVASGSCKLETVSVSWMSGEEENQLSLEFNRSEKEENNQTVVVFELSKLTLKLFMDAEHFPNASTTGFFKATVNASMYETKLNNSYRCNSEDVIALTADADSKAFVHLSNLQMEAFRTQTDDKFSSAVDCDADGVVTSDIVPIAVGCALAALVVIVLIAYLIGRRRARQRGYQSV